MKFGRMHFKRFGLLMALCFVYLATIAGPCGSIIDLRRDLIETYERTSDYAPVWSTDGTWLLFPWNNKIWKFTRDGRQFAEFPSNDNIGHNSFSPSISKYGSVLFRHFIFNDDNLNTLRFSSDPGIKLVDLHGGNVRELTRELPFKINEIIKHPVWSPTGDRFAFLRRNYGADRQELVIMASDGSNTRSYHTLAVPGPPVRSGDGSHIGRPVWSRDGSHIAVVDYYYDWKEEVEYWRLLVVRLKDGFTRILIEVNSSDRQIINSPLDWSFADDRIYFVMDELDRNEDETASIIYSIKPDGTDRQKVFHSVNGDSISRVDVSPDGEKLLFERYSRLERRRVLHVMNLDGTELRRLIPYFSVHDASWSPYGSRIAFSGAFVVGEDNLLDWVRNDGDVYARRFSIRGFVVMRSDGTDARWLAQFDSNDMPYSTLGRWVFGSRESIMEPVGNE